MNQSRKRIAVATVMALALMLLPLSAFAQNPETEPVDAGLPVCSCKARCAADAVDATCPACVDDAGQCTGNAAGPPGETDTPDDGDEVAQNETGGETDTADAGKPVPDEMTETEAGDADATVEVGADIPAAVEKAETNADDADAAVEVDAGIPAATVQDAAMAPQSAYADKLDVAVAPFASGIAGQAPPAAQDIRISYRSGAQLSKPVVIDAVIISNETSFELIPGTTGLLPLGSANNTWKLQPQKNLPAGFHHTTVTVVYHLNAPNITDKTQYEAGASTGTASFTVAPAGVVSVVAPSFSAAPAAYTQPPAQAITIANNTAGSIDITGVTLSGNDPGAFDLVAVSGGVVTIPAGGENNTNWRIQPKPGLAPQTYNATVAVATQANGAFSAPVSFTVGGKASPYISLVTMDKPDYIIGEGANITAYIHNVYAKSIPEDPKQQPPKDTRTATLFYYDGNKLKRTEVIGLTPISSHDDVHVMKLSWNTTFTQPAADGLTIVVVFAENADNYKAENRTKPFPVAASDEARVTTVTCERKEITMQTGILYAYVRDNRGEPVSAGNVVFSLDGTAIHTAPLKNGVAAFVYNQPLENYLRLQSADGILRAQSADIIASGRLTVAYSGDSAHDPSSTSVVYDMLGKGTPVLSASASPQPSIVGQGVTVTATVDGIGPSGAQRNVTFTFSDGNEVVYTASAPLVATDQGGVASLRHTFSKPYANLSVTAELAEDADYLGASDTFSMVVTAGQGQPDDNKTDPDIDKDGGKDDTGTGTGTNTSSGSSTGTGTTARTASSPKTGDTQPLMPFIVMVAGAVALLCAYVLYNRKCKVSLCCMEIGNGRSYKMKAADFQQSLQRVNSFAAHLKTAMKDDRV